MIDTADRRTLDRIYADYSDMVYRLALVRCGSRSDADDVFQEVFLRLVRKSPEFESEEHAKAWLIRVTLNCSYKLLGSAWNRRTEPLSESFEIRDRYDSGVFDAVQSLPEKYRTVIHLFYYGGYSGAEIARMLRISESAVRTRVQRAKEKLREALATQTGY